MAASEESGKTTFAKVKNQLYATVIGKLQAKSIDQLF